MPYLINNEWFATKDAVKDRCRQILARTPDSTMVSDADSDFLYELFQHHDEWADKAGEGVKCITTQITYHGTRCFMLRRHCDTEIDIGFTHAVKLIPTTQQKSVSHRSSSTFAQVLAQQSQNRSDFSETKDWSVLLRVR